MNSNNQKRILAECLRFLTVNGVNVTTSLRELIRYFFTANTHVSFADMKKYSLDNNLSVTESEIQGVLDLLVDYGFASKKEFDSKNIVYEYLHPGHHHDHFYCQKCGKIIEFLSPEIEELQADQARKFGFHSFSHKLQICGLCDNCFGETAQKQLPLAFVQSGGRFVVSEIKSGHSGAFGGIKKKLEDIGIYPSVEGEVISNNFGMIILNIGGNRVALRKGQSHKVLVTLTN